MLPPFRPGYRVRIIGQHSIFRDRYGVIERTTFKDEKGDWVIKLEGDDNIVDVFWQFEIELAKDQTPCGPSKT